MNVQQSTNQSLTNRSLRRRLLELVGVAVLLLGLFGSMRESQARLDPFFVLRTQQYAEFRPRILFMIDTSGSMTWKPSLPDESCVWEQCEQPGPGHSRIYAARKAIREVVLQTGDQANFALMSFGHVKAPKSIAQMPAKCYHWDFAQYNRFTWVTHSSAPASGYVWDGMAWVYNWVWTPITNPFGTQGVWMLCGDNRPFPYLRHDDLGNGIVMPNNSNEALLDEPLYKTKGTAAGYTAGSNYNRKIQWFSRYLGRRFNLNCADPLQSALVQASRGDWGTGATAKTTNVCGRDFYYWPYVDGFPGYSYDWLQSPYLSNETECYDDASCYTGDDTWVQPGTARRDTFAASLWSPFYSEAVLANPAIINEEKGPLTDADARLTLDGLVSDMYQGGIDASGGTPWRAAVGNVDYYVTFGPNKEIIPEPTFRNTNAAFEHYAVASYLAFIQSVSDIDLCRPTALVYITDGQPSPWETEGGTDLMSRMSKIRRKLGVRSYVVGFEQGFAGDPVAWSRLQSMACAAAGSTNYANPCSYANTEYGWDSCADKDDPANGCAWMASDSETLAKTLVQIIAGELRNEIPGGPGMAASEFTAGLQDSDPTQAVQTRLASFTDTSGFRGHVTRTACDTEDPDNPGELIGYCKNVTTLPIETKDVETYGPCPLSRVWDAGECLQARAWNTRRLYTHDANKQVVRIADTNGTATAEFTTLVKSLNSQGKLAQPLTIGNEDAEIQALAEFLLGKDMAEGWKLPGVPNSSPILVRRIPKSNENFEPSVGIRDPHCAGRENMLGKNVPDSLKDFADGAWKVVSDGGLGSRYEYAEAVLVGDDLGLLHAFHYDSGNELFAFLPMDLIGHARSLAVNGTANFGQSTNVEEHSYGLAATANVGYAFDHAAQKWRHLAVFGFGPGGNELITLDVSHMGQLADGQQPVDVVWTTSLASIAGEYDDGLGQTWSRPTLTYMVPGDDIANEPHAYYVFGSGYRNGQGPAQRGRTFWLVDAMTGETYHETAYMPAPVDAAYYDLPDDYAMITDAAVGTHCLSSFWGEMQEAYVADPAGRLYRWDIAPETNNPTSFPHVADSGSKWVDGGSGMVDAEELFRFPACQGTDEFNCTVQAVGSNRGDLFLLSPAIAANNRIDLPGTGGQVLPEADRDQFLIALVSGSPNDDVTDGTDPDNDFHSSLYLMTDDHRSNTGGGLVVPGFGDTTPPGVHSNFMRLPFTDIERTRTITFPNGTTEQETRTFSKATKPLRSPLIKITGLAEGTKALPGEVYYITFTVYEPAEQTCDPRWFDAVKEEWVYDYGSTYEITFRMVVGDGEPFDFNNNNTLNSDYGDGFGTGYGLTGPVVEQLTGNCGSGGCGMVQKAPSLSPCDPNQSGANAPNGPTAIQTGWSELQGFSPLEIDL